MRPFQLRQAFAAVLPGRLRSTSRSRAAVKSSDDNLDSYLKDEYLHIQKTIVEMDGRAVAIKTWSVSFGLASVVSAFVAKSHWVFLLSAGSICLFWLVEGFWKQFQYGFYGRSDAIERHFSGEKKLTAAFQIDAHWRQYWTSKSRLSLSRVLLRPHVALPHVVILLFALSLFLAAHMGNLQVGPNPSLEATATGKALGPTAGAVHHPAVGPSALPASAPQLKRYAFRKVRMASRDLKLLWGRAASTCALCRCRLDAVSSDGKLAPIGEAAHIVAQSQSGPRGQSILGAKERDSYLNLILLCPNCHTAIDSDPAGYPIEKLHMLKAEHELRVQGMSALSVTADDESDGRPSRDISAIVTFVKEWKEFLPFWATLFNVIDMAKKHPDVSVIEEEKQGSMLKEWHARRDRLKELVFLANEESLVVQNIPDWERLRANSRYISDGGYKTPFSFMLDFINPYAMVYHHGADLWPASFISQEFLDYLSFRYKEVKEVWRVHA